MPLLLIGACASLLAPVGCSRTPKGPAVESAASEIGGSAVRAGARAPLADGTYAVLAEEETAGAARVAADSAVAAARPAAGGSARRSPLILPYDRRIIGAGPEEPITYVAIDSSDFVPMILEGEPQTAPAGPDGRVLLSVTIARPYIQALERFTTRNLNGPVAILIDGEVVTIHKVRAVIPDGRLQITRCTDNACEILRSKLID